MTTITKLEVKRIYSGHGVHLHIAHVDEITADANALGATNHQGLNAHQWVLRWVQDELRENMDTSSFSERLEYDFSQN